MERLIRDNAINPSKKKKGRNFFRILEKNSEFVIFLLNKYDEEILAFKQASQDKKTEEAGDVLEVLNTLIDLYGEMNLLSEREGQIHKREKLLLHIVSVGLKIDEVLSIQSEKRKKKGGFEERIVVQVN